MATATILDEPRTVDRMIPSGDDFLTANELRQLTSEELMRRTAKLAPLLAAHAAEAEQLRRPVNEVWSALRRSGYFYQFVPKRFGGMATDLQGFFEATLPLAEACASTAWTASFCATHNRSLANFPVDVQEEIWGDRFPYIIAPQLSPKGPASVEEAEGGVLVTATWDWATGIMHADWITAIAMVPQPEGPPKMLMLLFPAAEAQVLDTWYVDGMAGTGSHEIRVKRLFVPERFVLRDPSGIIVGKGLASTLYPEAVYRMPWIPFSSATSSVVALGAARRAKAIFLERLSGRTQFGTGVKLSENAGVQIRLAEADLMLSTAETLMREGLRVAETLSELEMPEQVPARVAFRAKAGLRYRSVPEGRASSGGRSRVKRSQARSAVWTRGARCANAFKPRGKRNRRGV